MNEGRLIGSNLSNLSSDINKSLAMCQYTVPRCDILTITIYQLNRWPRMKLLFVLLYIHAFVRACREKAAPSSLPTNMKAGRLEAAQRSRGFHQFSVKPVQWHETCVRPHVQLCEPKTDFHFCVTDNTSGLKVINIPRGSPGWIAVGG